MSIIRADKNKNYTVMSNYHLRDDRLTLKAKGLLSVILSLPDDWEYSVEGLISICRESETAVKSAMKELKNCGYMQIHKERNKMGLFEYVYVFKENPEGGFPVVDYPGMDYPAVDHPAVENQGQLNTKELNTDELNTDRLNLTDISPTGRFEEFWSNYPKQSHKFLAQQAYNASVMDGVKEEWLVDAAKEYARCVDGQESRFIKNPENWLKENLYLDYPPGTYEKRKAQEQQKKPDGDNTVKPKAPYETSEQYRHLISNW